MSRFGRFELVQRLAVGGMGEVFLVRDGDAGEPLVLKRILPHLADNTEFLDLFLEEARIQARLNHPNVVRILELGDVEGAWYLLMERVDGVDLRKLMRGPMALSLACRIAADVAGGLAAAHDAVDAQGRSLRVVHADVSPHNVLVSFGGEVKLIDFGVAKAAGRFARDDEALRGKFAYMSPEQAAGEKLDSRSDQFALAVVVWELITGRRLFEGRSDLDTMNRVLACEVESPGSPVGDAVMRALRREPSKRFLTVTEFAAELLPHAASREQLAEFVRGAAGKPVSPGEVEGPTSRRPLPQAADGGPPFVPRAVEGRASAETGTPPARAAEAAHPSTSLGVTGVRPLLPYEGLALTQLRALPNGFSLEQAEAAIEVTLEFPEAPWALDLVQALRDKGHLRSWDHEGELRFQVTG